MPIDLPDYLQLYIFGSAVASIIGAHDMDILVIYDRLKVGPGQVYGTIGKLFSALESATGLRIHPTVLTREEAESEHFVENFACIPLGIWLAAQPSQ